MTTARMRQRFVDKIKDKNFILPMGEEKKEIGTLTFKNAKYILLMDDVLFHTLRFLSPVELVIVSGVSQQFHQLSNCSQLWVENFLRQPFLCYPLPKPHSQSKAEESKTEAKSECKSDSLHETPVTATFKDQSLGAYLYVQADSCLRLDQRDYHFSQALEFYRRHAHQEWTNYYLGMIHWKGDGINRSTRVGLNYLLEAFNEGDERASHFFCQGLASRSPEVHHEFKEFLKQDSIKVLNFEKQKEKPDPKNLGSLYLKFSEMESKNRVSNRNKAEEHLQQAVLINQDDESIELLATVILKRTPAPETKDIIDFFEALYKNHPLPVIARKLGDLYENYFDSPSLSLRHNKVFSLAEKLATKKAHFYYLKALSKRNAEAALQLGDSYLYGDGVAKDADKALLCFQKACDLDSRFAPKKIALHMLKNELKGDEKEAISFLKLGFFRGDSGCAKQISSLFRNTEDWQENPHKIWWIQVAAQCRCRESFEALKNLSSSKHFYIHCALAVIYSFGIPGFLKSTLFAGLPARRFKLPQGLLNQIICMDRNILEEYTKVGETEKLLDRRIKLLFTNWESDLLQKDHSGKLSMTL